MIRSVFFFLLLLIGQSIVAQQVYPLWNQNDIPFYKVNKLVEYEEEAWGTKCVIDITEPTLTIYPAQNQSSNKAVVIIPGGGYEMVAMYHEGYEVAEKLAAAGITAAVLKYRLPNTASSDQPHMVPLSDGRRAIRLLREKVKEQSLNIDKVGVLGFSAGSHLATVLGLWKSKNQDENPDFSALIYGVTILSDSNLEWLQRTLYHRQMTEQEKQQNRLLELIDEHTPPAFLVHAIDDDVCLIDESTRYANQLKANNIPYEAHYFSEGGHGFGLGRKEDGTDQWLSLFINWLHRN